MVLHSKPIWLLATLCFLVGGVKDAGAADKPASAGTAASTKPASPPAPIAATAVTPQEIPVCVRPPDVPATSFRWAYNAWGEVITQANEFKYATGPGAVPMIFVFDPGAPFDNVKMLRAPHNNLRCPGESKQAPAAVAPATQRKPGLLERMPDKPAQAAKLPQQVERFCEYARTFAPPNNIPGRQAKQFVTNMVDAITKRKRMAPSSASDLGLEAAELIGSHFRDTIAPAVVNRQAAVPKNVVQKFMELNKDPQIASMPLLPKKWVESVGGTYDTVPTVILSRDQKGEVSEEVDTLTQEAQTRDALRQAFEQAYEGHPDWAKAIQPFFPPEPDEEE